MITYRVKPFLGIPLTWVSEITQVKEDRLFVDEQRFGPYKMWHHQHLFKETGHGILMEDIIHYTLPFRPFSELMHGLLVKRQLNQIFDFRKQTLDRLFGTVSESDL